MAKKKKLPKPRGFGAFDKLTRLLIQVPKEELDKQLAKRKPRKRRK